jgi:hypothetical protein
MRWATFGWRQRMASRVQASTPLRSLEPSGARSHQLQVCGPE